MASAHVCQARHPCGNPACAGPAIADADAQASGVLVPLGVRADATADARKPGGRTQATASSDARNQLGGADANSVATATHGPLSGKNPVGRRLMLRG